MHTTTTNTARRTANRRCVVCCLINGFSAYKFSVDCHGCASISGCEDDSAFCSSNGMSVSLVKGTGHVMTIAPEKTVTCNYYCATPEQLAAQRATSPIGNYSRCRHDPAGGDVFFGLTGLRKDMANINFSIILLDASEKNMVFVSAVGEDGFSGDMRVTNELNNGNDHWVFLDGLTNTQAGMDEQRGVIRITYTENGVEKTKVTTCTYPSA